MKARKYFFPRRFQDILCFLLIAVFLPIIYLFDIYVVVPAFHDPGSLMHAFTFLISLFIVYNINGNMLACMMIDTSVDFEKLEVPSDASEKGWTHCKDCDKMVPPRSWHCQHCKACILKRDHHCVFTGCCIGHYNHRHFLVFVLFLFVGSIYSLVYNSLYLWVLKAHIYWNWLSLLKMVCPFAIFLNGSMWNNTILMFYNLTILAVIYSTTLVIYHMPIVLRGGVCFENGKNCKIYDIGWRKNLENVFGKRMHMVLLSPFVASDLPHDGTKWLKKDD